MQETADDLIFRRLREAIDDPELVHENGVQGKAAALGTVEVKVSDLRHLVRAALAGHGPYTPTEKSALITGLRRLDGLGVPVDVNAINPSFEPKDFPT